MRVQIDGLFPAHAGVIPVCNSNQLLDNSFPRTRGGDPQTAQAQRLRLKLFPAHAGVILAPAGYRGYLVAFPRTRGGDPSIANASYYK